MSLYFLLLSFFAPNLDRLGADRFDVREAETRRCDNVLSALMLPASHPDPEVNHRVRDLRTRNLKWLAPAYAEQVTYRNDFRKWLRLYVIDGDSFAYTLMEIFYDLHTDGDKAQAYFDLTNPGESDRWLYGVFVDGEWEKFQAHRAKYRYRFAPEPRPKP